MNLQNFLKKLPLVYLLFWLNTSLFSSSLDADKHKELDYQVKATSEFQSITKPAIDEAMANHATSKRKEADDLEKQGKYQQAAQIREEAKDWETGGKYRQAVDSITNAVGLALGGKPTEGVIAGAASPYNRKDRLFYDQLKEINKVSNEEKFKKYGGCY